jgi:hypothetical protein
MVGKCTAGRLRKLSEQMTTLAQYDTDGSKKNDGYKNTNLP